MRGQFPFLGKLALSAVKGSKVGDVHVIGSGDVQNIHRLDSELSRGLGGHGCGADEYLGPLALEDLDGSVGYVGIEARQGFTGVVFAAALGFVVVVPEHLHCKRRSKLKLHGFGNEQRLSAQLGDKGGGDV